MATHPLTSSPLVRAAALVAFALLPACAGAVDDAGAFEACTPVQTGVCRVRRVVVASRWADTPERTSAAPPPDSHHNARRKER